MIACLGETTGDSALAEQYRLIARCEEGLQILDCRPRINTKTIDLDRLKRLPTTTFGYTYWKFLDDNVGKVIIPYSVKYKY